jgi:hypothetical protein
MRRQKKSRSRSSSQPDQTLKELPQPQDEVALGFFTWKDEPTISST